MVGAPHAQGALLQDLFPMNHTPTGKFTLAPFAFSLGPEDSSMENPTSASMSNTRSAEHPQNPHETRGDSAAIVTTPTWAVRAVQSFLHAARA